ncbi:hypothetical protein [Ureibacillus chungkukjangi]|uniref:Uncharacterized protein n=1 Tax=Ureibacillus chungkukjangi TaxID=1202712 RepID=A0A318TLU7_9BACL|nr:hypothetical protein [Ureibacillus chungkukjangi]PYF05634.1 hypothetical protein BJ095_11743 [Ureibacillus chungkukjangi]
MSLQQMIDDYISHLGIEKRSINILENKAVETFLNKEENTRLLFSEVSSLINKNLSKKLFFETTNGGSKAYTLEDNRLKKIFITLRGDIKDEEVQSVLIHELGEADYLARRLPIVVNTREDQVMGRLIELFSHPHCRRLSMSFGLSEIEGLFRNNANEICINNHNNNPEKYDYGWQKLLGVVWYLITYPDLWELRDRLDLYCEYKEVVDEIIEIVSLTDTMGELKLVEEAMQKVLEILYSIENQEYRLPSYCKIQSRA